MRKYLIFISTFLYLLSCKEKPTYNPFDNQFNIDESYIVKDMLDTINTGCGYYHLTKKDSNIEISYGYFENELIGKAFSFKVDTINIENNDYDFEKMDSINSLHFNPLKLNNALKRFDYRFLKQIKNEVLLINKKQNKIDTALIHLNTSSKRNIIIRSISFLNKNKNWKGWN